MTIHVMHREVCLKHRKNRREILLRVRTQVPSWQRCLFFFVVSGAGVTTRAAFCGHRPRARFLNAIQRMPVQVRLTAPLSMQHGGRQLAQLGLQNLAGSGQHRDAVPLSNCGVAKRQGNGLISRHAPVRFRPPLPLFLGRSIIQEVTRLASGRARCEAVAVHHFAGRLRTIEVS